MTHNFVFYASDAPIKIPTITDESSFFNGLHTKVVDLHNHKSESKNKSKNENKNDKKQQQQQLGDWTIDKSFVLTEDNVDILDKKQLSAAVGHYRIMDYYFKPSDLWLPLA